MKNGKYELIIAPNGYPGKKYRAKYAYEHTVVWWKNTGQIPPPGYEIHHKNMNHRDNRIENLQILSSQEHRSLHAKEISLKSTVEVVCGWCEKVFARKKSRVQARFNRNKYKKVFCSPSCGALHQHKYKNGNR